MEEIVWGQPASVMYESWMGSAAGDPAIPATIDRLEELLGVGPQWRIILVDVAFLEGSQAISAYAVDADLDHAGLLALAASGTVDVTRVVDRMWHEGSDGNLPAPVEVPVGSATDFLLHGFKALSIRLRDEHAGLAPDTVLRVVDTLSDPDRHLPAWPGT